MGLSKHMGAFKHTGGVQMYGGRWKHPKSDKAFFLCVMHVQGASKHMGGIQIYWGIQTYRGCTNVWEDGHPLSLTKHAFFVVCSTDASN